MKTKECSFRCSIHGKIKGDRCIICEAQNFLLQRGIGLLQALMLTEGPGPEKGDPSPRTIRYRAFLERRKRQRKEFGTTKNGSAFWQRKVRIVRSFPDYYFEDVTDGKFY